MSINSKLTEWGGKSFLLYLFRFLSVFCILYYGTQLIIGLTVPGNYYSSFVDDHLDYISTLRKSLLEGSRIVISLFGYDAIVQNNFFLKVVDGSKVRMVYSCLGIGVISFWASFVIANKNTFLKKLLWVSGGCFVIWLINVARICLLLIATNDKWKFPFELNHHTMFNIAAYGAIFLMMYFFDRSQKKLDSVSAKQ